MYNKIMKHQIENVVRSVLEGLSFPKIPFTVVATQDPSHGDYATSIAFSLAKELKKSPKEIAEAISSGLAKSDLFEKVEVAGNGFVNLTLATSLLPQVLHDNKEKSQSDRIVLVEFTDPNPFKEFHIGHLYSNIVGEAIARLIESTGTQVKRVNYQGDVGLHVAKALWGLQQQIANGVWQIADLEQKTPREKAKVLGESYALGASAYEEDAIAKEEIIQINKDVYKKDPAIMELYTKGRQWSLDYFETVYARLMSPKGSQAFDRYYFESEAGPIGQDIVKENPTVFKESDGAIVFPGEEHGLHTRVFINSLGLPTYEAKELGLAVTKYKEFAFDQSIMITGNEINEYFKVLLKALSIIKPEVASKMKHLSHGMVRLPEGKMSSRTGNVITGEWLLDEAVKRAEEKINEVGRGDSSPDTSGERPLRLTQGTHPLGRGVSNENASEISEIVGVGAVKWALLKGSIGKDIEFSFDDSISFEGNSGPYIQYTFVRTQSILKKIKISNDKSQISNDKIDWKFDIGNVTFEIEERELLVALTRYNDIISEAVEKFSPHIVTTYLFELAQSFNNFYQKYPILKGDENVREFRLALTTKVGETIQNGLYILGIQVPERM